MSKHRCSILAAITVAACSGRDPPPHGTGGTAPSASSSSASGSTASSSAGSSTGESPDAGLGGAGGTGGTSTTTGTGGAPDAGPPPPCTSAGQPLPAGTPCDDANPCNGLETCDGLGNCLPGTPPILDDADPCTFDSCDPTLGITHTACTPVNPTTATTIASSFAFLITGPNPPQTDVAPGTIDPAHAAILRGHISTAGGSPFVGATITIVGHPEFGATASAADGTFTMLVNGGGPLTVDINAPGFIRAQRTADVPWNDYARADDVVLLPFDTAVSTVDLASPDPIQIAQSTLSTDGDGDRRATLMFAAGTSATLTMPGGTTQPLSGPIHVRATEFTVGEDGPAAMPGSLPPASAYTYAVELSLDEAVTAGATRVDFDHPIAVYVDNFLALLPGVDVPAGYYDPARAAWIASTSGRVLAIVSETAGLADVDIDGDGLADDLTPLGITDAERAELAILHAPGDSLWRVPVQHFTSWDFNLGFGPPNDACAPFEPECNGNGGGGGGTGSGSGSSGSSTSSSSSGSGGSGGGDPVAHHPIADPCEQAGSVIECENQTLGESVPITGTPFRLHYRSDRVPGRTAAYSLTIPLAGPALPTSLDRIDLQVDVAGRSFHSSLDCPCAPGAVTTFTWDGRDVFGRQLQGAQPVTVTIGYAYAGVYGRTDRFGSYGIAAPLPTGTRREVILKKVWRGTIGVFADDGARGLGGWSLSVHHAYDPTAKVVYRGDGTRHQADAISPVIHAAAGSSTSGFSGDGGPATAAKLNAPRGIAVAPDESVFIADTNNHRIRRVDPDGTITTIAGHTMTPASGGDGGPASAAGLAFPVDAKLGPDGSLYVAEQGAHDVRRIAPDGTITTVVGNNGSFNTGFAGDGGPATSALLNRPMALAIGRDGTLFIADADNRRVRAVGTDGIITTIAGGGALAPADGIGARDAQLGTVEAIAAGRDGSVYFASRAPAGGFQVYRVTVEGRLFIVAGTGDTEPPDPGHRGDGGLARQATFAASGITSLAATNDGALLVVDGYPSSRVRRIGSDGTIAPFAGVGQGLFAQEAGPAAAARFSSVWAAAVAPDGTVLISDSGTAARLYHVAPMLPGIPRAAQTFTVPAEDARTLDVFDASGKHLQTLDARTGAALYTFGYGPTGLLATVTDVAGNLTSIARDANGTPTAIIAPHGQSTALALDAQGWLKTITNPASETTTLDYYPGGLLASFTDAKNQAHQFTYDALGRLEQDTNPTGGFKHLDRTTNGGAEIVTVTTALGHAATYTVSTPSTGGQDRVVVLPNGTTATAHRDLDEASTVTTADGMTITTTRAPDPRFGMAAAFTASEITTTPGGLARSILRTRTAPLGDPADLMSFTTLTETTTINGLSFTSVFDRAARRITTSSPLGRGITTDLDTAGRVVGAGVPGILPLVIDYDAEGRLKTVTRGTRTWSRTFDPQTGDLQAITDPIPQTTSFTHDLAGRVQTTMRPDQEVIVTDHDANGNVTGVTPPEKPLHVLDFDGADQLATYTPPAVDANLTTTTWHRDLDGKVDTITRPDGLVITRTPDAAGRLGTITLPAGQGTLGYSYDPQTGKLAGITGPMGTALTFGHDGALLTDRAWSGAISGHVHHDHDNHFRIGAESINGTATVAFGYDNDGLLVQAGPLTLTRDPQNGMLAGSTLGVIADIVTYDAYGDLDTYAVQASGALLLSESYPVRDQLGRIKQRIEVIAGASHTFDYAYDPAGRLTDVLEDGALAEHYDYDANGNRTGATTAGGSVIGTYDAQDRLMTYGAKSYTFTAAGELESVTDATTAQTTFFSYDALGALRGVQLGDGTVIDYEVDGERHRIGKRRNGAAVQGFLWSDGLRVAAELDGAGNVVARFVYATRANVPDVMVKGGKVYRLVTDHLGSVRLVVDSATGAVVQRMSYDAQGRVLEDTNPGWQPFGFAGGLYDHETGLTRFGARDYDAETGRWTAKDPLRFEGGDSNLYGYCGGDPVNRVDPTGRVAIGAGEISWDDIAKAAAGIAMLLEAPFVAAPAGILGMCALMSVTLRSDAVDEKDECDEQYETDSAICRRVRVRLCWETASERYGECIAGKPIRPLGF